MGADLIEHRAATCVICGATGYPDAIARRECCPVEMVDPPSYDEIADRIAERVQDADHIVAEVVENCTAQTDYQAMMTAAIAARSAAVNEERFMHALVHDQIVRFCQTQIDDGN